MPSRPAVLMAEPHHFLIRGGANPHTRNQDGSLKTVEPTAALAQWSRFAAQLTDAGVDVYVLPAVPGLTGLVFPANAGVISRVHERIPLAEKRFFPSEFSAQHRIPERPVYIDLLTRLGFAVGSLPSMKFEGEADLFPVGPPGQEVYLFTSGELKAGGAATELGPDGAVSYGFRSDGRLLDALRQEVAAGREVLPMRLIDPRYYHGDTCFCSLGDELLWYPKAVSEASRELLRVRLGADRLIELDDDDAARFVANSVLIRHAHGERALFLPEDASDRIVAALRERELHVERTRLTEFLGKGGGGGKCMVLHLGVLPKEGVSAEVAAFRDQRRYRP